MIRIIISGGQTGVDRAALDFAMQRGILCTGWCPRDRAAEDGAIPLRYPLIETEDPVPEVRTEKNVMDSDGTLVIVHGTPDPGTGHTIEMAYKHEKPFFMHDLVSSGMPDVVAHWLRRFRVQILNIAGPRESLSPGIHDATVEFLIELFAFLDMPEESRFIRSELEEDDGED